MARKMEKLLRVIAVVFEILLLCLIQGCLPSKVLVTGGGGFIGYHTSLKLVEAGTKVIVLDNFSSDHNHHDNSIKLKKSRAHLLAQKGVTVLEGSSYDIHIIEYIFRHYNDITGIVHAAAYTSIQGNKDDPLRGAENTVKSMVSIMNSLIKHKHVRLVYMSSSGVYSSKSIPPLSPITSNIDPQDMYNTFMYDVEELVQGYCHDYELSAVGLRLFTVYGPWDRPGNIVYDIAKKIQNNEPVELPYKGDTPLTRDLIYIDDVVQGIMNALKYKESGHKIFNIGNGVGVPLTNVIDVLKKELEKDDVKIIKSLLPANTPISSYADFTGSHSLLNKHHKTTLEEGIKTFVQWWKRYTSDDYSSSLDLNSKFDTEAFDESLEIRAHAFRERLADQREKYTEYAIANNIPVAKFYRHKTFKFHPDKEAPGTLHRESNTSFANMKRVCELMDDCVGFNTKGEIKTILQTSYPWTNGEGLYIADIDVCQAGLHNCFTTTKCVYEGPSLFSCQCDDNYVLINKNCIEKYAAGKESVTASDLKLRDRLVGVDISQFTLLSDSQFHKYKGKDSVGGDLLYVPDAKGNIKLLEMACRSTYHCIGYSTNGLLKKTIKHSKDWTSTTDSDLYTLSMYV